MRQTNQSIFEAFDKNEYFTVQSEARYVFKILNLYAYAVGYDSDSHGYLVIHKGHSQGGLNDEIEAVLLLKQIGLGIALNDESQIRV